MALDIEINGKRQSVETADPVVLSDLLRALELRPDRIAVECNGEIIPRSKWTEALIASGDRIEVVHFVGGGSCFNSAVYCE